MSAKLWLRLVLLLVVASSFCDRTAAADSIPVLRTKAKTITIIDGSTIQSNYWVLMPERNPDLYYVEIPRKPHTVTFCSDLDLIAFPMGYGEERDLVILQNDKISCPTRIRAVYRKLQPYSL